MIDRFNFYDIYVYLIPGAVWLALLGLPFYLTVPGLEVSLAALTTIGLGGGYLAGHYLSGLARKWLPSVKVSETILDEGDDKLAPSLRAEGVKHLRLRFGLDASAPGMRKETFYLFRSALTQAKGASYVEQYQGISTMMRSLAVVSLLTIVDYVAWVVGSVFGLPSAAWNWTYMPLIVVAIASVVPALVVALLDRLAAPKKDETESPVRRALRERGEVLVFCGLLALAGFVAGGASESTHRQHYVLSFGVAICSMAYWRFKGAYRSLSVSMAQAAVRDFLVLSTAKTK